MAFNSIMSGAISGVLTNQQAIRVTGENIANVGTENYARQEVRTEANLAGSQSAGVRLQDIQRVVDGFLETARLESTSDVERSAVMSSLHDRLQGSLGSPDGDTNLAARLNSVFETLATLAQEPANAAARQQVIGALDGFAREASRIADQIQSLRGEASARMEEQIEKANQAIEDISRLNGRIVQSQAVGGDTAALENSRQDAISTLSEAIGVRVNENPDGSVNVLTTNGLRLVGPGNFQRLDYNNPGTVTPGTDFPPVTAQRVDIISGQPEGTVRQIDKDIVSGALSGLIAMRDDELVELSVSLGELSARVADEVNRVHNGFSAVPPPNSLDGQQTAFLGSDPHNFTGQSTFAVVDSQNRLVSRVTVDFDDPAITSIDDVVAAVNTGLGGAGTLSFAGGQMSFSAANAQNGVAIAEDSATASDRAGRGFSHFFGMNDLLSANQPGLFETGVATGDDVTFPSGGTISFRATDSDGREVLTATLDTTSLPATPTYGDIVTALNDPATGLGQAFTVSLTGQGELQFTPNSSGVKLSVTEDLTDVNGTGVRLSELFGIGDSFRAEAARGFGVIGSAPQNAARLATASFDLTAAVGEGALSAGDQSGILALQQVQGLDVTSDDAGEIPGRTRTLGGFVSEVLGNIGAMADRASGGEETGRALLQEIDARRENISGVNLDEELANLVIFQNSYNAAARVLSSVQDLFDSLLAAV